MPTISSTMIISPIPKDMREEVEKGTTKNKEPGKLPAVSLFEIIFGNKTCYSCWVYGRTKDVPATADDISMTVIGQTSMTANN